MYKLLEHHPQIESQHSAVPQMAYRCMNILNSSALKTLRIIANL